MAAALVAGRLGVWPVFFFAVWFFHDDRSGWPRIPARVAGMAVAAAVLAELNRVVARDVA
jgi:hypothetical protein